YRGKERGPVHQTACPSHEDGDVGTGEATWLVPLARRAEGPHSCGTAPDWGRVCGWPPDRTSLVRCRSGRYVTHCRPNHATVLSRHVRAASGRPLRHEDRPERRL